MPILFVLVFALLAALASLFLRRVGLWLFFPLASASASCLSYFFLGIYIARWIGHGRFFSFPVGGFAVRDSSILLSVAAWMVLWAGPMFLLGRLLHHRIHPAQRNQ